MPDTIVTGAVSLCNSNLIVRVIKSKYLRNFKLEIFTDKRLVFFPRNHSVSSVPSFVKKRERERERRVTRNVYIIMRYARGEGGKKEKKIIKEKKKGTRVANQPRCSPL